MTSRASATQDSPNACLRAFLLRFFADGTHLAALRYRISSQAIKMPLLAVVRGGPSQAPPALPNKDDLQALVRSQIADHQFVHTLVAQSPWANSKMAAEFVALLCADLPDLTSRVAAAAFNSRKLGGAPTMAQVRMQPSGSLTAALSKAIAVQRAGDAGRAAMGVTVAPSSTCLVVSLADCNMLRAEEQRVTSAGPGRIASYAHRFALLVDPKGVGLYQAWGNPIRSGGASSGGSSSASTSTSTSSGGGLSCGSGGGDAGEAGVSTSAASGYTLEEWLQRSTTLMSYDHSLAWAGLFEEFCGRLHWDVTTNGLYLQLFGVDLKALAAASGLAPPGRIKSWFQILEVPYVTGARILANGELFM